jgi:thiol-disulfide isomerase/thioredoxin
MLNQPLLRLRRYRVALVIIAISCCAARENPQNRSTGAFVNASTDAPLSKPADLRVIIEDAIPLGDVTRDIRRDKNDLLAGRFLPLVVIISPRADALLEDDWPHSQTTTVLITTVSDIDDALDSGPSGPPGVSSWRSFLIATTDLDNFAHGHDRDRTDYYGVFVFGPNGNLVWYAPGEPSPRSIHDGGLVSETVAVINPPRKRPPSSEPDAPPPPQRAPVAVADEEPATADEQQQPTETKPKLQPPAKTKPAPKPQPTPKAQPPASPQRATKQPPLPPVTKREKKSPLPPPTPTVGALKGLVAPCGTGSVRRDKSKLSVVAKPKPHKAVMLSFWAKWCVPCVAEFPELAQIAQQYANELTYVGLLTETCGDPAAIAEIVPPELRGSQFELLDAGSVQQFFPGRTFSHPGMMPIPFLAVFDETGRLMFTIDGSIMVAPNQRRLRTELDRLAKDRR